MHNLPPGDTDNVSAPEEHLSANSFFNGQQQSFYDSSDLRNIYYLFEAVPFAVVALKGPDLIIEYINQYNLDLWQCQKEEVIDKPLFEVRPNISAPTKSVHEEIYRTKKRFEAREVTFVLLDNGKEITKYFDVVIDPLKDEKGIMVGQLAISIDITEKVLTRRVLEESEERFQLMANTIPEVIWVTDGEGREEFMNQRWDDYCGVAGKPSSAKEIAAAFVHPDDAPRLMAAFTHSLQTGEPMEVEQRNRSAAGEYRWFLNRASPYHDSKTGKVVKWFGISVDIHDRKLIQQALAESESRFRTMAEYAPVWIWMTDEKVNVSYANNLMLNYLGLSHYNEFSGRVWERLTHPDDIQSVDAAFTRAAEEQQPFTFESRVKNSSTEAFEWCLFKGVPHFEKGNFIGFIGTGLYIHQQKTILETSEKLVAERTRELAHANKELYRSNEDLQQFAHVASHDMKEPVRKALMFTSRLKHELRNDLSETAALYLSKIESSALRMSSMIDGVLLYSSLNALKQTKELIDLYGLIQTVAADLEVPISEKKAQVRYSNLPVVQGFSILLYQLFYNLINNALKFARANVPPVIELRAIEVDSAGINEENPEKIKFWEITVEDNGIGFKHSETEMIFTTFKRLHSKEKYEGTGLGLTLCRNIVERHGGTIKAAGKEGEGARFTILLPKEVLVLK